jgi:hypothetical protein
MQIEERAVLTSFSVGFLCQQRQEEEVIVAIKRDKSLGQESGNWKQNLCPKQALLSTIRLMALLCTAALSAPCVAGLSVPFVDDFERPTGPDVGGFWMEAFPDKAELQGGTAYLHGENAGSLRGYLSTPVFGIDRTKTYVLEYDMKLQPDQSYTENYYPMTLGKSDGTTFVDTFANDGYLGANENYYWYRQGTGWIDTGHAAIRDAWVHMKFSYNFAANTYQGWENGVLVWDGCQFKSEESDQIYLAFATGETTSNTSTARMWIDNVSFVPEPSMLSILGLGAVLLLLRRLPAGT